MDLCGCGNPLVPDTIYCADCLAAVMAAIDAEAAAEAAAEASGAADVYFVGPDNSSEEALRNGPGWIDPMERRWLEG